MGKLGDNICYICLKENEDVRRLSEIDDDKMTYKEKLIYCVKNTLESLDDSFICAECITLLKDAYTFINMVLNSQRYLKMCNARTNSDKAAIIKIEDEIDVITPELDNLKDSVPPIVNTESEFICKICNTTLRTRTLLQKHFKMMHNSVKLECLQAGNKLDYIPLVFDRLKDDVPDIVGIKPEFVCKICNTKLKTHTLLERHFNTTHKINKRHECSYCQKMFKQSWHLQDHLSSHTGEKNYKCAVCEKTFLRASSLRRHFKTHQRAPGEKVKPTPFLCFVCGKKFIYSNGLQRHMRIHLGIKQHECEVCKRKFSQKTHLLAHTRTHTGEKPYVCDTCGEAFSLNANLRKHISTHQKDVNVKIEYNCY